MVSNRDNKKLATKVLRRLKEFYPGATCTLDHKSPFQLLVATILSAQCTDDRVNKVTPTLFQKYPTPKHFAEARIDELEQDIRPTGFFRQKARNIRKLSQILIEEYNGEVPRSIDLLTKLPGIGRKTANVVLGTAFRMNEGIAVDTHVKRLSGRLGLTNESDPEKIEKDLMKILPREEWTNFSHLLIHHGREYCKARKPMCSICFISDLCPYQEKD